MHGGLRRGDELVDDGLLHVGEPGGQGVGALVGVLQGGAVVLGQVGGHGVGPLVDQLPASINILTVVTRNVRKTYPKRSISWTHSWHWISAETAVRARGRRSRERSMAVAEGTLGVLAGR